MKKHSKLMAILLVVAMILPGMAQAAPVANEVVPVERIAGSGRVQTAVEASKVGYAGGADAVVLAGYSGEVDALTGTLLANAKKAPVLLTRKEGLSADTKTEIERLGAKTVYILGGESVVSKKVVSDLEAMTNITVERVEGDNRYATAHEVAKEVKGKTNHVFLALGEDEFLADALSVGSASAVKDMPVLLTKKDFIPQSTLDAMTALGVTDITLVGGINAISEKVEKDLKEDYTVDRVWGVNRERTAAAVANEYFPKAKNVLVAQSIPDALVGGYLGAKINAPILLTKMAMLHPETEAFIKTAETEKVWVLGGDDVISVDTFKAIEEAIKGEEVVEELKVESVSAINAKTLKVTFNKAVEKTADAKFEVKRGSIVVPVTAKWNDEKTTVELSSSVALPVGDYTVMVSGVETAKDGNTGTITMAPERIEEIKVAANGYRDSSTATTVKVAYDAFNQYGEKVTDKHANTNFAVTASRGVVTGGQASSKGEITLTSVALDVTSITVSVVDRTFGKTANQTVTVRDSKMLGSLVLGQPELKTDKDALEQADTNVVIPYTAENQFGEEVKLVAGTAAANGFTIISSNTDVVDPSNVVVNTISGKDKLVIQSFGSFNGTKEVTLTAIANATGTANKVVFSVNGASIADTPTLIAPTSNPGLGENPAYVELKMVDNFGKEMKAKDIAALASGLTVISSNDGIVKVLSAQPVEIDGKAYITINAFGKGTANLTVTVNATGKSSTVPVTVVDAKVPSSMTLIPSTTLAAKDAKINFKASFKDQYGADIKTSTNEVKFTLTGDTSNFTGLTGNKTVTELTSDAGIDITVTDWNKSVVIKAELYDGAAASGNVLDTKEVTLKSIKSDDKLTYSIEEIPTLYGNDSNDKDAPHAQDLVLVGLLGGNKVALPANYGTFTTTNALFKANMSDMKIWAESPATGNTSETGTIAIFKGATKLAEATVKSNSATPVPATATVEKAKITLNGKNQAETLAAIKENIVIKDQYGVDVTLTGGTNGIFTTSDTDVVTFSGNTITKVANGTATIGFVTNNGKSVTFELVLTGAVDS